MIVAEEEKIKQFIREALAESIDDLPKEKPKKFVSEVQLMEMLGISRTAVNQWEKAGMPVYRPANGRLKYFEVGEIHEWILKYKSRFAPQSQRLK